MSGVVVALGRGTAGFAVGDQELAAELYAIAAPVRNEARDVVAAVKAHPQYSQVVAALAEKAVAALITAAA